MDKKIIIFSGMSASGKDSVTQALCANNEIKYVALKKHRSVDEGMKHKDTYFDVTREEFEQKIKKGDFLQYHTRYDRYYGIDKKILEQLLKDGCVPIIHIGKIENYYNFKEAFEQLLRQNDKKCQIVHIMLWEERDVLKKRIRNRETDPKEQEKRIKAVEEDFQDNKRMLDRNEKPYSYIIKNSDIEKTCQTINEIITGRNCDFGTGYEEFMKYVLVTENLNVEGEMNTSGTVSITCKKKISNYKIKNRYFARNVAMEDIWGNDVLEFENCVFQDLKLSKIGCEEIRFINCAIEGELRIFKGKMHTISIRSCQNISKLIVEEASSINSENHLSLKITNSGISYLKIIATEFASIEFTDVNSSCEFINFVRGGKVEKLYVSCNIENLAIKELPKVILTKEGKIADVELESIDKKTLRKYEKEIVDCNKNGHIDNEFLRYKSVVLAAYESFEKRKMFTESDICLFEIRRLGILIKKSNSPLPVKIAFMLEKFFAENCFGWGINIINNIVTMLCVITGFSGIYYVIALVGEEERLPFKKCFEIAMNRFFTIGSNEFSYTFLPYMDSLESIMGVILLTVITGVLVRKIIR